MHGKEDSVMKSRNKGIEAGLTVVITIVVLVVLAVAVIVIFTGNTQKTDEQSQKQIGDAGCTLAVQAYCVNDANDPTAQNLDKIGTCKANNVAGTFNCSDNGKITYS
jgi:type II secretory pathway pseudopilin PulG